MTDLSKPSAPQLPSRLDLKVGFSCNNRCQFCVQGDKRERFEDRHVDELIGFLESHRAVANSIVFTGGEPTLHPDLLTLIGRARALGYHPIQVQTNGRRLAYKSFVRALADAGVTEIAPALHGSNAAIHDGLTRARSAFIQVVRGIKNARAADLPVITNTVVVRDNLEDLVHVARLLVELRVQQVQFAFVHPVGSAGNDGFEAVVARLSDAVPHIQRALDVVQAAGIPAFTEAVPYCFMSGYEHCVVERRIPDTLVVDAELVIEDYSTHRVVEGKAKGPRCPQCTWTSMCEGPWREYPERFGWDEFEPRTDPVPGSY